MIDRILQIIDYKCINKSIFYKQTGLSNGFLDKVKDIGASKLELILNTYPEISMQWLLTGEGSMLKDKPLDVVNENKDVYGVLNKHDKKKDYIDQLLDAKDEIISGKNIVIENQKLTIDSIKVVLEILFEKSHPDKANFDTEIKQSFLENYLKDAKEFIKK